MRKAITLACFVLILFAMGSCNKINPDKKRIAELEDSITLLKDSITKLCSKKVYDKNYVGTYEVIDTKGQTFYFTLNDDETAQVTQEGSEAIWYCTLRDNRSINRGLSISFTDRKPWIWFENGVKEYGSMDIQDGWLYASYNALTSKHPQWRLKIEQIE